MMRRMFVLSMVLMLGLLVWCQPAFAQSYPTKPIRIVIANAPGSTPDFTARTLGQELNSILGQPVIVEPKPGANQLVGLEYVMSQPADGYTMLVTYVSALASMPLEVKNLSFDPINDLPPLTTLLKIRAYLASPKVQPWTNMQEMVAYAKANPGRLNYGTNNVPLVLVLAGMARQLGIDVVRVAYRGNAQVAQAGALNEIQLLLVNPHQLQTFDSLIPLAVTGSERSSAHPSVPSFAELGLVQMRDPAYSLNIRKGTPTAIVDRLSQAVTTALKAPKLREAFAKLQYEIVGDTPEQARKTLLDEAEFFRTTAESIGLKPE